MTRCPERLLNDAATFLPHDLLRIGSITDLECEEDFPSWVNHALTRAPFVVVRRAPLPARNVLPIGIRGRWRQERFAAFLPIGAILESVAPEQIAASETVDTRELPVFAALERIRKVLIVGDYSWGPTGSVGFELASGIPTATPESDLDVVIRAPIPLCRSRAADLFHHCESSFVHIDIQLDTPTGAVALAEYVRRSEKLLVRTVSGALMTEHPWLITRDDE